MKNRNLATPTTVFVPGQTVRLETITYGGAVYDRKGNITNSSSPGIRSISTGLVERVELECGVGPWRVTCRALDKNAILETFSFYPQHIGPTQIVELLAEPVPGDESHLPYEQQSLVYRLRKRAEIRRQIPGRRSVQNGEPDRLADLLEEAATVIEQLKSNRT
jgi:hypothetical protein